MESDALDLKSEREKKNISLEKIAADTRINLRYLRNIEEGNFSNLPGGVYNRAFIKAYCESINLDPQKILKRYDLETARIQTEKNSRTNLPIAQESTFSIPSSIFIWVLAILLSVVGIFLSRGCIHDFFSPYFSENSANEIQSQSSSTEPIGTDSPVITQTHNLPAEQIVSSKESVPPPVDISVAENDNALSSPKENNFAGEPEAISVDSSILLLEIEALEQCWISVDVDGIPSSRRLMEPGEVQTFTAKENMHIIIGNAGGVRVKINDKPTKPLGMSGDVVHMDIEPQNLMQYIASPDEVTSIKEE